jgi:hypothetical protein
VRRVAEVIAGGAGKPPRRVAAIPVLLRLAGAQIEDRDAEALALEFGRLSPVGGPEVFLVAVSPFQSASAVTDWFCVAHMNFGVRVSKNVPAGTGGFGDDFCVSVTLFSIRAIEALIVASR